MAVYKIFPSADATVYSAYITQNTGLDEILEVSVKNNEATVNGVALTNNPEDLRRSLILFASSSLATVKPLITGSYQANLRLYLAEAENLTTDYTLEVKQVSQSWDMGTGKFADSPPTINGVCWNSTSSYVSGSTSWLNPSYYTVPGGGSWTNISSSQSFDYAASKDMNADVTRIVDSWFSGSLNAGFLVKHPTNIENNPTSYIITKFFSVDTHTIYPPTLEVKWDDSRYVTGSMSVINNNSFIVNVTNNTSTFKYGTGKYRMLISARDKFPTRTFSTSSIYLANKALPATSYWAIQDLKTEEMVIDFDSNYTKISCNGTSSYFDVYMAGLEPERYYRILMKTQLPTQEIIEIDNDLIFKIQR